MNEDENHLKPQAGGDMNLPPRKPRVATGFFGEDGFSSKQIAEEIEEIIKYESNNERIKVHQKMVGLFRLEAKILPRNYHRNHLGLIIDASIDAADNGYSEKLISLVLQKRILLGQDQQLKKMKLGEPIWGKNHSSDP